MLICGKLSVALKQTLRPLTRDPSTPLFGQPQVLLLRPKTEKVRTQSTTMDSTQPGRYCRANASLTGPAPICQFWTNRKTVRSQRNEWMMSITGLPLLPLTGYHSLVLVESMSMSRLFDPEVYTVVRHSSPSTKRRSQDLADSAGALPWWLSKGIPH